MLCPACLGKKELATIKTMPYTTYIPLSGTVLVETKLEYKETVVHYPCPTCNGLGEFYPTENLPKRERSRSKKSSKRARRKQGWQNGE